MSAFLSGPCTSFALCWRVERRDGIAIGCTNHDCDLTVDGFRYRSTPGIAPSAIEEGDLLEADGPDIAGALSTRAISEADLSAGRWDGAEVRLFAVDWSDPSRFIQLMRGEIGSTTIERGSYTAELKGPAARLDRPVCETTSPMCRAQVGDRRCRVDMAARRRIVRVVSIDDVFLQLSAAEPSTNGWGGGHARWIDGPNAGLVSFVLASEGATIELAEPPPFAPQTGDRLRVEEGCDKRFATCRDRFENAENFRGEPHLPGMDLLTRYPGE